MYISKIWLRGFFQVFYNIFPLWSWTDMKSKRFYNLLHAFLGAALVGLAAAPLWTAKATYLNQIARYHSEHKKQTHEISVSLFFGIFFALFGTNTIWGNLISYFVLNQSSTAQKYNCGIHFDPQSAAPTNTTQDVNDTTVRREYRKEKNEWCACVSFLEIYSLWNIHWNGIFIDVVAIFHTGFSSINAKA